jgi:DNA-binding transcriptional LysR family regulator
MAELRHYRYFVEIARRGTFTAAAEALNMTQSGLSEQILQFERECGSPLFNRGHSGATLTPAGEYLLPQAESLLAKAAETREGLASFRNGYQDRLRVSSVLGPLQSWLPAALAEFAQVRPHVQLQVHHNHSVQEILTGVAGDHLDVGVVSLRPSAPARSRHEVLVQRVLLDEDLVLLAPPGHSLAQLAHVTPRDLEGAPLVAFPADYNVRQIIDAWCRCGGSEPIVAAETGALEVMLHLIVSGVGVAIVPRSLAVVGVASGLASLPLDPNDTPRRIVAAVHRTDGRTLELVHTLVELMDVHARDGGRHAAGGKAV